MRSLTLGLWVGVFGVIAMVSSAGAGDVQPDRLELGEVREEATVEASVLVYADGIDTAGMAVKIDPPPFVRVVKVETLVRPFAPQRAQCGIWLSIDTRKVGVHSGALQIQFGKNKSQVPVSISVLAQESGLTRVLAVETPFQKYSTTDGRLFKPWTEIVKRARLDVNYLLVQNKSPVFRHFDLSEFDVVLLGCDGLFFFGNEVSGEQRVAKPGNRELVTVEPDIIRLKRFAERGGRVIVAASAGAMGAVGKANELLRYCGLEMQNTRSPLRGHVAIEKDRITNDPLTSNVKKLCFFNSSPITVTDKNKAYLLAEAPEFPSKGYLAYGRLGKGDVIALGNWLWWSWISEQKAKGFDNGRLLENLVARPRPPQ